MQVEERMATVESVESNASFGRHGMIMSPMLDLEKPVLSQFRKSPIRKAKVSFTSPRRVDV